MIGVIPMREYFLINENGISEADKEKANLEIYRMPSERDKNKFIDSYKLPKDIFHFDDMPEIAPRIETLENNILGELSIFVISNINEHLENLSVEDRLESHTFLLTKNKLFWFMHKDSLDPYQYLFNPDAKNIDSLESFIVHTGLLTYKNFTIELNNQKNRIDDLHRSAMYSTSNAVLISVADTERDMVMLQHTIDTQEIAFKKLLENQTFLANLNNDALIYDIKWYNRQVNQLVLVYRDLLDATSSLFTDIMSNNLNQLMKFLSSLSLILASSTFIASLWGMNTGGLPFKKYPYGSLIMLFISLFAGFMMYLYLKRKDRL